MTEATPDQRRAAFSIACRLAREFSEIAAPNPGDFGLPADATPAPLPPPLPLFTQADTQPDPEPVEPQADPPTAHGRQVQQALERMQAAARVPHTPRPKTTGPAVADFSNRHYS